jgi:tetratricopeptide (TPR) repeat protein
MAYILRVRGDLDGAMSLYQQALEIKEGLGDLKGKSATLHAMANVFVTRGDLDGAMKLYQQSLEIHERLGDLQGKAATLHAMANVFVTRGDLDGAMKLYQQALAILEGLGDLQGKSATLAMMGQVLWHFQKYEEGLRALLDSLGTLLKMGARLDAEKVAGIIQSARQNLGAEPFDRLWREITGQEPPDWLAQAPQQELMTVEEFITRTIQAARQKKPEAEAFFAAVSEMAADPDAPPQLQALGEALRRILAGETTPDLSALPEAWAALIRSLL